MKCPYCRTENDPTDENCRVCGKPMHRSAATAAVALLVCRRCGTEHPVGFCPACGRWNGPLPGGFRLVSALSFVNAAILILTGLLAIAQAQNTWDPGLYVVQSVVLPVLAAGTLFAAFNLLRVRRWALKVIRVVLVTSVVVVLAGLAVSFFHGLNPVNFMNLMITVLLNTVVLFSLKQKDYLFTDGAAKPLPELPHRRCVHCGCENLTGFDRICPKCKKELA